MAALPTIATGEDIENYADRINSLIGRYNLYENGLTWTAPTLLASFTNVGTSEHATAGHLFTPDGFLFIKGLVTGGTAAPVVIFELPDDGRRPLERYQFDTAAAGAIARVDVLTNGQVILVTGSSNTVSLNLPPIYVGL